MTGAETLQHIISYGAYFIQGFDEGLGSMGMTWDDDPNSPRSAAYDIGRSTRRGMIEA